MRSAVLIAMMILLYTLQSLLCKKYADHYPGAPADASPVFTMVSGVVVVAVSFAAAGFSFFAAPLTLLFALFNAVALIGYNAFIISAAQMGAYSVLMVFSIAGGILIPVLSGVVFFGDGFSLKRALAFLLIFAAVYLVSHRKGEAFSTSKWFLPVCVGLGVCNGAYGALLDAQQRLTGAAQKEEMVAFTYALAVLASFLLLWARRGRRVVAPFRQTGRSLFYLLVCAVIVALAIHVMVAIIPLVDIAVLYTFDNAGTFLFSVVASVIFFRERLSRANIAGCVLMCIGLVMVSIL